MNTYEGLTVPEGWAIERVYPTTKAVYLLVTSPGPNRLMATVDLGRRGVRSGLSITGNLIGERPAFGKPHKPPSGRGWKQACVDAAVAHLVDVQRW